MEHNSSQLDIILRVYKPLQASGSNILDASESTRLFSVLLRACSMCAHQLVISYFAWPLYCNPTGASKVQSGKTGRAPGRLELSKGISKWTRAMVLGLETLNLKLFELKSSELTVSEDTNAHSQHASDKPTIQYNYRQAHDSDKLITELVQHMNKWELTIQP